MPTTHMKYMQGLYGALAVLVGEMDVARTRTFGTIVEWSI